MNRHRLSYSLLMFSLCIILVGMFTHQAIGFTQSSENYTIEQGSLSTDPQNVEDSSATSGLTGPNYTLKEGSLSFSISQTLIDFGPLSPTNPVSRATILGISSLGTGYQVVVFEDHTLTSSSNATIPDSSCDNGSCSETTSAQWTSGLTYGLGYRCDNILGSDCEIDFSMPNYYKRFPDISKKEQPQFVLGSTGEQKKRKARITYKMNAAGTQLPGIYTNSVTYIAVPSF